jgi:hypothetical protein
MMMASSPANAGSASKLQYTHNDSQPALHGRAPADLLKPTFEVGKLLDVLILSLPVHRPRIGDLVRDGVFVACQVRPFIEAVVEYAVEPVGLVVEAAYRVAQVAVLGARPLEMAGTVAYGSTLLSIIRSGLFLIGDRTACGLRYLQRAAGIQQC